MRNVGIAGSISYDKIGNIESLGGITYNLLSLALDRRIKIFPVTYLGKDIKKEFMSLMTPNIDLKYVIEIEMTNRNVLHVYNNERYEFITPYSPEIDISLLENMDEDIELILINPVMGWEFKYETLNRIKELKIPFKMLDVHSLTLGIKENGERFQKMLEKEESRILIENFDIIQMNMREYYALVHSFFPEGIEIFPDDKIIIVSDAEKGAYIYNKKRLEHYVSKNPEKKHIIGAGDIFSGIFISFFLNTKDPFLSVKNTVEILERINGDSILDKINSIKEKYNYLSGI